MGDEFLFNVGVIGKSGSGKSSFINAYLGLGHTEEYAAKTDVVECTSAVTPYHLPGTPVILWDVPGYDTLNVQYGEEYLKSIGFYDYDFYIHISSTKTQETEFGIHNAIAKQMKRYFYVRTMIDRDLGGQKKAYPRTFNEESEKAKLQQKLELFFPDVPIFLVNSLDTEGHDLPNIRLMLRDAINLSKRDRDKLKVDQSNSSCQQTGANSCVLQ